MLSFQTDSDVAVDQVPALNESNLARSSSALNDASGSPRTGGNAGERIGDHAARMLDNIVS